MAAPPSNLEDQAADTPGDVYCEQCWAVFSEVDPDLQAGRWAKTTTIIKYNMIDHISSMLCYTIATYSIT